MIRVLIFGSGFAGEGHTTAFREVAAEVVGMVGRTREVVENVANRLSIPYASTDLSQALEELSPDVVSIATPSGAHLEPVSAALERECHLYCDKPLAANSEEARGIEQAAETVGVKTAYAASFCYEPSMLHAAQLAASGAVGRVRQLELISHYEINPLIPWHRSHSLAAGGGRLNKNFAHKLAISLRITGGVLAAVAGSQWGRACTISALETNSRQRPRRPRLWNGGRSIPTGATPSWRGSRRKETAFRRPSDTEASSRRSTRTTSRYLAQRVPSGSTAHTAKASSD